MVISLSRTNYDLPKHPLSRPYLINKKSTKICLAVTEIVHEKEDP